MQETNEEIQFGDILDLTLEKKVSMWYNHRNQKYTMQVYATLGAFAS